MFVQMCVTCRRGRGRSHKVYIFLISINSPVDIALSVWPFFEFLGIRYYKS